MKDEDIGIAINQLEGFISKRVNTPLLNFKKQSVFKKSEQKREKLCQEVLATLKTLGNDKVNQFDDLLGETDITETYCKSVYYLVGLTDGVSLRNIFGV